MVETGDLIIVIIIIIINTLVLHFKGLKISKCGNICMYVLLYQIHMFYQFVIYNVGTLAACVQVK